MHCNFLLIQLVTYVTLLIGRHTGKSFSEARNICKTCCVPKLLWLSKQSKKTICVHNMFCRYSELTIFMNNSQSVVILWVRWCKNKSFWQRFTCISALWGMWKLLRSIFLIPRNLIELLSRLYLARLFLSKAKALHNVSRSCVTL
jgi:hypothetical protein